ncbi:MAG: hypothetical protein H7Z37_14920 [Pyrinomonadaceae bacterium]|nr:hypothetical protein [Pyrinomonadaceae bacterium]
MAAVTLLSIAFNLFTLPQMLGQYGFAGRPREPNYAGFAIGLLTIVAAFLTLVMIYNSNKCNDYSLAILFLTGGLLLISFGVHFSSW